MKKILFLFLVTSFMLPVSIQAREGTIPSLRQELKSKKVEIKNEIKVERQENQDKNLDNKRTKAQATLKRLRQGIVNRYENILKQKAKIEARLAKVDATKSTEAKAKLATFSDTKYKSDLAAFDIKVAAVLASDTPLKLTADLKASAKVLDTDLKDLRTILADTLRLIVKSR